MTQENLYNLINEAITATALYTRDLLTSRVGELSEIEEAGFYRLLADRAEIHTNMAVNAIMKTPSPDDAPSVGDDV